LVSPAHAATPGVGTALTSSSLLDVKLGSLLNLKVLADEARSTIDPSVAQPEAFSRLNALSLTSVLPAPLNNISLPVVESKSPGGSPNVTGPSLNLATPLPGVPVPAAVLGGVLNAASLTSGVDAAGAHSALTSGVGNISLVGGLISASGLDSVLGAIRAELDAHYDNRVFISGFVTNALVAVVLTFIGDRLGIDLYLVALFAFGLRIFQNVALIRRHFL